ncbi:hypothetical protein E6H19_09015 [Candidatus Bathyarchaeota archaeon]|nr:MAG: hypothetical protein E6H30_01570 [Candidatus Bathyarchaeota archaeon]TMI43707.1 MAG: hypothetical protein E6H19_09015 [Candidatus Bathyarchaeota archaeon]
MPRRLMWSDLDRPLKISALSGIFWGSVGLTYVTYSMLSGNLFFFLEGTPEWLSLSIALSLFPIWLAFASAFGLIVANTVLLLYPLFLVSGGLSLLGLSMQRERRGILGFLVFMGSVPFLLGLFFGVLTVIMSLVGIPVFRN